MQQRRMSNSGKLIGIPTRHNTSSLCFEISTDLKNYIQGVARKKNLFGWEVIEQLIRRHIDFPVDLSRDCREKILSLSENSGVAPEKVVERLVEMAALVDFV